MLPRVALANSRNVPAADLLARLGLDQGYGFLRRLGLHDDALPADRYGLGPATDGWGSWCGIAARLSRRPAG